MGNNGKMHSPENPLAQKYSGKLWETMGKVMVNNGN